MTQNNFMKNTSTDWQQVKLGDIGKVSMCKRIFKYETFPHGPIPFYKISTFGKIADSFISNEIFEKYTKKYPYPKKGEILISASGTIGRTVIFDGEKSYFQDSNIVWISNPEDKVLNDFLKYVYPKTQWKSTDGGIISRLYNENIRSIKISLPPLPEQHRIVAVLETWDNAIDLLKKKIALKKEVKKGLMQKLLTGEVRLPGFRGEWKNQELGELLNYEQPIKYLVSSTDYSNVHDTPVLTAGKTFLLGYTDENEGIFNELPVIIFDDFTTANKFVTFPFKVKSSAMKMLSCKNKDVNLKFIFERMQFIHFPVGEHKRQYLSEYQYIPIKIPNIEEQNAIAEFSEKADREITLLEQKLHALEQQKKFLLNNLVTGEIRTPENLLTHA